MVAKFLTPVLLKLASPHEKVKKKVIRQLSIIGVNFTLNYNGITFRVSIHVAGAGADDKQFIFFDEDLAATTSRTVVIGICLSQTDVVKVYASAANVSFNLLLLNVLRLNRIILRGFYNNSN